MPFRNENFRLVFRVERCRWVHNLELQDGDIDATDLNGEEFQSLAQAQLKENFYIKGESHAV